VNDQSLSSITEIYVTRHYNNYGFCRWFFNKWYYL